MISGFDLTKELSQNTLDFIASQLKTIYTYFVGNGADGSQSVPAFTYFYGKGATTITLGNTQIGYKTAFAQCDICLDDITLNGGEYYKNVNVFEIPTDSLSYYKTQCTLVEGASLTDFHRFLDRCEFYTREPYSSYSDTSLSWRYDSPCRTIPASNIIDWGFPDDNYFYYISLSSNVSVPSTWDDSSFSSFNSVTGFSGGEFRPVSNTSVVQNVYTNEPTINYTANDNNTYNFSYDYGNNSIYISPDVSFSFDGYADLFNNVVIPYIKTNFPDVVFSPDLTFPSYSEPPFAYIQPIHELNYSLDMPDTSEYLDVSAVAEPLSIVSDSLAYFWNAITDLGLSACLGFCLVATLIIKGLRGD